MTTELTAFLLARFAEDEAAAERGGSHNGAGTLANDNYGYLLIQPARVLAECEAKRRIVAEHKDFGDPESADPDYHSDQCSDGSPWNRDGSPAYPCPTLKWLAFPYTGHEDFRDEWRA